MMQIRTAKDYIIEKDIANIDFIKIDTEGYELDVLRGFEDYLYNVNIIQFEYGGTYLDNNIKLIDVINHLKKYNFNNCSYLTSDGSILITNFTDHYQYCNIIATNIDINN